MAQNASNDLSYYLVLDEVLKSNLGSIRSWNNLKIAFDEKQIWVKDLDYVQINSLEIKSIPYKTIFYAKQGKLFLLNSLLPNRNIPSLLWTAIDRALPIKLPSFNHNYFGIQEKISISIIPSEMENEAVAMATTVDSLKQFIETAPAIRLQKLNWVLLNNDRVFLFGKPLLPINGDVYWKRGDSILPTGFDFDLSLLSDTLNNILNPENLFLVVWNIDSTYSLIAKDELQQLSLSSFRKTMNHFSHS
ncbi:MAG: hypothetical protein A3F72_12805 [Bacteroidetes bacterium RIFCSPLOWO2_12_FULL_35_15]|nr:MAG: hypothetical protein A3F72_12805 [Bacteroidetes bacterium RIFCSPLOWO2_12_FULL_35_15]